MSLIVLFIVGAALNPPGAFAQQVKAVQLSSELQGASSPGPLIATEILDAKALRQLPKVEIIVDSSGSMGQLLTPTKTKMFIIKKVLNSFLRDQWKERALFGMRVYGSRDRRDCQDSVLSIGFAEKNLDTINRKIALMDPLGMTPLNHSMQLAIEDLKGYKGPKRIVIFTDGQETCGGDPCALAKDVEKNKDLDIKVFIVALGFDPKSEDYEKVKCMGSFSQTANNEEELLNALGEISSQVNRHHNLAVKSPNPDATVFLYHAKSGKRELFRSFTARWGTSVPPGDYEAEVDLVPRFKFPKFTIPPREKVTLTVSGKARVKVNFMSSLLNVELLNKDGKVVYRFKSDQEFLVDTGLYKLKLGQPPYYEELVPNFLVAPNGAYIHEASNAGVVTFKHADSMGYYIYTAKDELVGNFITNYPVILKQGTYRFYLDPTCEVKGVAVGSEKAMKSISCDR